MSAAAHSETTGDSDLAETLERAERDRDSAWEWWTREQERNSQLCAQNDVLMREIRHLRGQLRNGDNSQQRSAQGSIRSSSPTDSEDGSFCKVSLSSINSISAINGGNPLGATSLGVSPSRPSVSGSAVSTPMRALSRVVSKGRALHRNHQAPKHMSQNMDSVDSFAQSSTNLSPLQGGHRQGRLEQKAKRVVSRVFQHFTPDSKRRGDANKPYLAGRFANTDAAVGSYSAEVLSFEQGPLRDRGNSVDTRAAAGDQSPADARMAKVRSIVYSGPIVAHPTGGVSVTFTSQEVHELPIDTNSIPEQLEDEAALEASHRVALSSIEEEASGNGRSSSPQGTKRTRAMMHKMAVRSAQEQMKAAGKHADSRPSTRSTDKSSSRSAGKGKGKQASTASSRSASQSVASVGISSAATIHSTGKKKRKLHAGRTVLNIGSPDSDYEEDSIANAPQVPAARSRPITPLSRTTPSKMAGAWPQASPSFTPMSPVSAMVAKAAQPEENKQPVLFTPIRTRSKVKLRDLTPTHDGVLGGQREEKSESIFLTPMKMLSRLRNRKK
ncbi:hypothetical protein GQ54DRAFT_293834 [Martensiomyces pterosporus]|nr:hypothetical protein GQ54DRAFT_293834 [Martensiomyces pterosporus]